MIDLKLSRFLGKISRGGSVLCTYIAFAINRKLEVLLLRSKIIQKNRNIRGTQ